MAGNKIPFSNTVLKAINPPAAGKPEWYYDERVEGLAFCVSRTGARSFMFKRWVDGGKVEKRLGSFVPDASHNNSFYSDPLIALGNNPALTTDHARTLTRAVNGAFAAGTNPFTTAIAERDKRRSELTLGEMFDIYLERHYLGKRKRPADVVAEFNRDCGEIAKLPLSAITTSVAHQFHARVSQRSQYAANRRVQLLRAIFNKAILWELFDGRNPFSGITMNREKPRDFALTPDEAARLWEEFEKDTNEMIRDWGRLAMLTGARKGELCGMRWIDIRWDEKYWKIEDTKNGDARLVALGDIALEILADRRRRVPGEWVFPGHGIDGPMKDPKKAFERIRRQAGLDGSVDGRRCTIHDLRRSFGTEMARQGVDRTRIKEALGHKDEKTTARHYIIAGVEWQREAQEKVTQAWLRTAERKEPIMTPVE